MSLKIIVFKLLPHLHRVNEVFFFFFLKSQWVTNHFHIWMQIQVVTLMSKIPVCQMKITITSEEKKLTFLAKISEMSVILHMNYLTRVRMDLAMTLTLNFQHHIWSHIVRKVDPTDTTRAVYITLMICLYMGQVTKVCLSCYMVLLLMISLVQNQIW